MSKFGALLVAAAVAASSPTSTLKPVAPHAPPLKIGAPAKQQSYTGRAEGILGNSRGTDAFPIVIRIQALPKTKLESSQEIADRQSKENSDWWIVRLTGALVFATLAVVGVTTGLWVATHKLWRAAQHSDRPHMLVNQLLSPDIRTPAHRATMPNSVTLKYAFQNYGKAQRG